MSAEVSVQESPYFNQGLRLAATFYTRADASPEDELRPGILMLPGLIGSQRIALPDAGRFFVNSGFHALAIDSRGFGKSEGERWNIDCPQRVRDAQMAITHLQSLPGVDPGRIGVYGSSFGGSIGVPLAAADPRVSALVTVGSPSDGRAWMESCQSYPDWLNLLSRLEADMRERCKGRPSEVNKFYDVMPNYDQTGVDFVSTHHAADPDFYGKVTLESMQNLAEFRPIEVADRVSPTPLLIIQGDADSRVPLKQAIDLYDRAREPKRLHILAGATHYEVTNPGPRFDETLEAAREWYVTHLTGPRRPGELSPRLSPFGEPERRLA